MKITRDDYMELLNHHNEQMTLLNTTNAELRSDVRRLRKELYKQEKNNQRRTVADKVARRKTLEEAFRLVDAAEIFAREATYFSDNPIVKARLKDVMQATKEAKALLGRLS